ncbi:MAG: hypothetical protein RIQ53_2875 [Pseudomonadota bacterium]|jgi:hypothetical protein
MDAIAQVHQARMLELHELERFSASPAFRWMSWEERDLILRQLAHMRDYRKVLGERIAVMGRKQARAA